jgi:N-acetylglucosaminyldiphosphoundecaprenol N-acetyl-beta-D-mannosaminyltransferase
LKSFEYILGYPVTRNSLEECVSEAAGWVQGDGKARCLVCLNPHSFEVACKDDLFSRALKSADMVVPDGIGVVMASRILGGDIRSRITGSDIFWGLNGRLNRMGGFSCFFLGSTGETLAAIAGRMKKDYPNIRVAGTYSPPFRAEFSPDDTRGMVEAVNHARPDVLWVGMTAPKQEKWIYQAGDDLDVRFIGAVGAVFDFYACNVKRAHSFLHRISMEWLDRTLRNPGRMWQRAFLSNPKFALRVLSHRLRITIRGKRDI